VRRILLHFLAILAGLLTGFSSSRAMEKDGTGAAVYHLSCAAPRAAGLEPARLKKIDAIVEEAIREGATPGAVVLVLKDGEIVFDRAYGHHTYEQDLPTRSTDIFDLASITKISATTLAVMRLVDLGKLNLDATVGTHLRELKKSHPDKAKIRIRDLLTHQAGFVPEIPFYAMVKETDHRPRSSKSYPVRVSESYYLKKNFYKEVMWPKLLATPLKTPGQYVYSDLGMYILKEIVERIVGKKLDAYVEEKFYRPLGACTMGFCPWERQDKERLVPTGIDGYFRKQLLHGFVQDPGAALSGGVAGHAGLFATAYDLALIGQMLLNGGSYGGREYFRPGTVRQFTARQSAASRRGLGFDRWDPDSKEGYPAKLASPETFGHTGYTGTCLWIDPERRLVYVFLSNRTYPKGDNKLLKLNVRARVQDAIYEALGVGVGERPTRLVKAAKGKGK
jgi:CubicO group peptidase (beta-lactamase class C family)